MNSLNKSNDNGLPKPNLPAEIDRTPHPKETWAPKRPKYVGEPSDNEYKLFTIPQFDLGFEPEQDES